MIDVYKIMLIVFLIYIKIWLRMLNKYVKVTTLMERKEYRIKTTTVSLKFRIRSIFRRQSNYHIIFQLHALTSPQVNTVNEALSTYIILRYGRVLP